MKKKRYLKKKKEYKGEPFIPSIYVPTFLGAKLNMRNHNQLWDWKTLEEIKQ